MNLKQPPKYIFTFSAILVILLFVWAVQAHVQITKNYVAVPPPDTLPGGDSTLPYPIKQDITNPLPQQDYNPLYLKEPANITTSEEYDPQNNQYIFNKKAGSRPLGYPAVMTFEEYQRLDMQRSLDNYWKSRAGASGKASSTGILQPIRIGGEAFDRIFGGNTIDIRPQGSAELIFGIISNKSDNASLNVRQRRTTNFDFKEKIQLNATAKIGDKIEFQTNYNTEASFEFENKLKLKYEGKEDEIIKLIEAGDVTLPLNSTLITGSQSLFGIKTQLQFGKTTVTGVYSEQKSQTQSITVQGGAQTNKFSIKADAYEENRHFFIAEYFRNHYEEGLSKLPVVMSNINITKIEVWVTQIGAAVQDNRNIVALADLGEYNPYRKDIIYPNVGGSYPFNLSNNILSILPDTTNLRNINKASDYLVRKNLVPGQDYEVIESARKLNSQEYTYNSKLGFISLNTTLNSDQALGVAIQYTVIGDNKVYQLGEFSDQGINAPQCLVVKLLKSTALNTRIPMWDLMMKNVYSIGAYQVNRDDFMLNILYSGNENGVPTGYFTEGKLQGVPLLQVFNFDNLDPQSNPPHDGMFDFLDGAASNGGTIQSSNGRVYFTMLEPFGQYLRNKLQDEQLANKYCYDSLYSTTKTIAQQYPAKNKFVLDGIYKSSASSEISLNALNVPQGSVKVMAGGIQLQENIDYTVDYTLGMVRIINDGYLNSGTPIRISLENNAMFNVQTQRLMGAHIEHALSNDFKIGATILNMRERPLTQKTNFGYDPISNTIWGMDVNYQSESRLLTKLVDKLPFITTKAPSRISFAGEFAHFIPGHSSAIGSAGTSYIDDFEGSESTIDLKSAPIANWFLASTPQGQIERGMFPEAAPGIGIEYGFNRAKLAWYVIDPLFYERNSTIKPANVDKNELSKNAVRPVLEKEVFPNADPQNGQQMNLPILNLAYYPSERGQYNYDVNRIPGISEGLNSAGILNNPETRWGGIMRKMETTDFEATNVEYIEFWMMDPFASDTLNDGGDLYINLGDISEDILRDSRKSYENGLPTSTTITEVDTTIWGRVPKLQALIPGFDNSESARKYQDVGYDGLRNEDEQTFFYGTYLQKIIDLYGTESDAYLKTVNDPSADDYHYFLGTDYNQGNQYRSILEKYKMYNGSEGNSPASSNNYATTIPNIEDINKDNTLNTNERYFQYRVNLRPDKMQIGQNYITDIHGATVRLENNKTTVVNWYQFKIPIRYPEKVIGNIQDFKSIRFMRMFFKNFTSSIVCRFATLELVRGEWRKYDQSLLSAGEYVPNDEQHQTQFDVSTVNIEENGNRLPIPYVLPPDIQREINMGAITMQQMNEQSIDYKVVNLLDGDARAAFKTADFDFRMYKKIKMYVHAEELNNNDRLQPGDLTVFLRLGSDFTENYYEYEIPVEFTPWHTGARDKEAIWPENNEFNIDIETLIAAKQQRNEAIISNGIPTTLPYVVYDGANKITIVGMPSLSDVKAMMIGVRNPKKRGISDTDDGKTKSAEFWFNEFRVSGFDEKSGFAATGRLNATLADLGNVIFSGGYSTPGFGSIEKRINDRQKETLITYDVATNLELGKFFPEKSGLRIPMHFDFSESKSNPQYNPLDPDVLFKDLSKKSKDSLKKIVQDYTQRKNINFMNVRKEKTGANKKNRVYDIENFDFTYAYSEIYHRNIDIQYDVKKTYRGGIGYNFINNPKPVKPFDKVRFLSKYKSLQLVKDFNFYLMPKLFSFRTDMNRAYNERKYRNKSTQALIIIEPTYVKSWEWARVYDFKYDFSQGLKLEYSANANAYIDEPAGKLDKHQKDYKEKRDSIIDEILGFGTLQRFNQSMNITYNIPINKIPLLNFTNASARYGSTYRWEASPQSLQEALGNTIENSNNKQINANVKLSSLYSKFGFLKNINPKGKKPSPRSLPAGKKPGTEKEPPKKEEKVQDSAARKPFIDLQVVKNAVLTLLTGIKEGSMSYSETNGTLIPGFMPKPNYLGNRWSDMAPGLGFVFGSQENIRDIGKRNGWFSTDSLLNTPYLTKQTKNLSFKATAEPINDLRIDITADRTESINHQEYYLYNYTTGEFETSSMMDVGSYSISYGVWNTSFDKNVEDKKSETFEKMKNYRMEIAQRLAAKNPNWSGEYDSLGYPVGYGATSTAVLIPSFLAAYSGQNSGSVSLTPFPRIPKPNWRLTYGGLSRIEFLQDYVKNVNISHAYRSTYSVASYRSNILYHVNPDNGYADSLDVNNNFIPEFQIDAITITEQYSPLFGIDITWVNNLLTRFEYKRSRNLAMSFTNNQMTDISSSELVFGLGYRFKEMELVLRTLGIESKKSKVKSDLNIKADLSIRNDKTVLRRLVEDSDQISAGKKLTSINISADYVMNQNLTIRAFFEKQITNPFVSTQYPNSTTNAGISLRFMLAQ